MTKPLDMNAAYELAANGDLDAEIAKRLASVRGKTADEAAATYLEVALIALGAASHVTVDETARAESIDDARAHTDFALRVEPG